MRKIFVSFFAFLLFFVVFPSPPVFAEPEILDAEALPLLTARINSESNVELNKKLLFDASESTLLLESRATPVYRWDFGDGSPPTTGTEVLHDFARTGAYRVRLTLTQGGERSEIEREIFVFDKRAVLVTDDATTTRIGELARVAAEHGVLLNIISSADSESGFITEEKLVQRIQESASMLAPAQFVIFFTKSSLGIQAFARYTQTLAPADATPLRGKFFVKITEENIKLAEKIALQAFRVIGPRFILLTRPEALNPIFESTDSTKITEVLASRAVEYRIVDERSDHAGVFLLSRLISNFSARGIPTNVIYLLLAFPFAAFIVAFFRQVIGLATFGVYTPTVLSISFLILGIKFGLAVLFVVLLVSYLLRLIFRRVELLYIPRIALQLSLTTLSFFGVIWFVLFFGSSIAVSLAIFPMIVMATISEKFLSAQDEEGLKNALLSALETILIAVGIYYLIAWSTLSNLLLSFPELVLLPLLGTLLLGRFSGLRLTEYFRFRGLLRGETEE